MAASRVVLVLSVEYCVLLFGPPAACDAAGPIEASLSGGFRGTAFRTTGPFCAVFVWSNFFFKSFTLCCATPRYPTAAAIGLPVELSGRSSTGLDVDRNIGRTPLLRGAESGGCLGVAPLVVSREGGGICRPLGIAEAMEKASLRDGEGCSPVFTGCALR